MDANAPEIRTPAVGIAGQYWSAVYVVDDCTCKCRYLEPERRWYRILRCIEGANASALYSFRGLNGAIYRKGFKDKKVERWWNSSTMLETGFLTHRAVRAGRGKTSSTLWQQVIYDNARSVAIWPRFEGQLVRQYDSPYDPVTNIRTPTPWLYVVKATLRTLCKRASSAPIAWRCVVCKWWSLWYQDVRFAREGVAPNTKLNSDNSENLNAGYNLASKLRVETRLNLNMQYT